MYELLILSALMVHDRTGYKLSKILEATWNRAARFQMV